MSSSAKARANRAASSGSSDAGGAGASRRTRARWSRPLTAVGVVSSIPAASAREKSSTSQSTTAAVWRGGRRCSAAMNASRIVSWRFGSSQVTSLQAVGSGASNGGSGASGGRRLASRIAFRQRLVAIL